MSVIGVRATEASDGQTSDQFITDTPRLPTRADACQELMAFPQLPAPAAGALLGGARAENTISGNQTLLASQFVTSLIAPLFELQSARVHTG